MIIWHLELGYSFLIQLNENLLCYAIIGNLWCRDWCDGGEPNRRGCRSFDTVILSERQVLP